MTRYEEKENFASIRCKDIAGETDYKDTAAFEGIIEGANWADKTMIDKACNWLLNIDFDGQEFRDCDESFNNDLFVNEFRKAMEE